MNKVIYLVRHGETLYNKEKIFRGRADVPLNDTGREQAAITASHTGSLGIEMIYSSPMKRALETAEIICDAIKALLKVHEAFQNIHIGEWQGQKLAKVEKEYPEMWKLWKNNPEELVIPGGEMIDHVRERSYKGLKELVTDKNTPEVIMIVSHRSVLKCLIAGVLQMESPYFWKTRFDNCSLSRIDYSDEGGFSLIFMNNDLRSSALRMADDD